MMSDEPLDIEPSPVFDPIGPRQARCVAYTGDQRIEGLLDWSLNRCQNSRWAIAIRPEEHFDGDHPWYTDPSYMEPRSEDPIRAVAIERFAPYAERCAYHYGTMVINDTGYFDAVFCSNNNYEDNMLRMTVMEPNIKSPNTPGLQEPSYYYWAGAYEAPPWTEAHFHGAKRRCGQAL